MAKPKIQVILGSIRDARAGESVARWFMDATKNNPNAELELVDLKDYPLPLFTDAGHPAARAPGEHSNPQVQRWLQKIMEADGYIFLTAEYNHSLPGAFKNALDYLNPEVKGKVLGIASYGGFSGGSRAAEHIRQIAGELHLYDVRDQLIIPFPFAGFDEQGQPKSGGELLTKNANTVVTAVAELAVKMKSP